MLQGFFRFFFIILYGHTFATRGNEFVVDTATLSEPHGHAKKSTTLDMYVHSIDETKLKARNTFDQM